jgi:hypothetical protein
VLAETGGQAVEHPDRDLGVLLHELIERGAIDAQQSILGDALRGGVAALILEQRQLAEEVARAQDGRLQCFRALRLLDLYLPLLDDEHVLAGVAFLVDDVTAGAGNGELGDVIEVGGLRDRLDHGECANLSGNFRAVNTPAARVWCDPRDTTRPNQLRVRHQVGAQQPST